MSRITSVLAVTVVAVLAAVAPAGAADYAQTARNVLPHGQYQLPSVPGAADQARLYDGLTPLFRDVDEADLGTYFKDASLRPATVISSQTLPERPGVRIDRAAYGVPHIYGQTDQDVIYGAGYVLAQDRSLLLDFARYNGVLAAIDAPNINVIRLITSAGQFRPTEQANDIVARQTATLRPYGAAGRLLLRDIDLYLAGINSWYRTNQPATAPFTRTDIYAINAVKGQFLGQGGGAEVGNSLFLDGLQRRFGARRGFNVWTDLKQRNDPEHEYSVADRAPYQAAPRRLGRGNVILRNGSYASVADDGSGRAARPGSKPTANIAGEMQRSEASNILMVSGRRSATGHPLFVGGPQIGYNFPGLTLEMGLHGPSMESVGSTSAPFPGYPLIGRGEDYAWSLTSAGSDIIDQYAETLCGGSRRKYRFKGRCLSMQRIEAGTIAGTPERKISFYRTVHGPVVGYGRDARSGREVAIARKRSTYGRDVVDQLFFQRLAYNRVKSFADFKRAAALTPQTFNSFYADDEHTGVFTSGRLPLRPRGVSGDVPVDGSGRHEWRGYLSTARHAQGMDPGNGLLVNWNNKPARDYPASDDRWGEGSIARDELLLGELASREKHTLASVTAAMNAGATQDVRIMELWPVLREVLRRGQAPSPRATRLVELLDAWRAAGGSRLDREPDGRIDDPGAAILDAAWDGLSDAGLCRKLGNALCEQLEGRHGRFDAPPGGQYNGWHQYMDKDLRTLLGRRVRGRFSARYCGRGVLRGCSTDLWAALEAAGAKLAGAQGADPAAWRADATAEDIEFGPLPLITMRYANRPSGIQQVMEFRRHRPGAPR